MAAPLARRLRFAATVLVLSALFVPAAPASSAGILVVDVDEPFVVDGRSFGPAELSFRQAGSFTPSTGFDEIRVDGTSLGLLPVRSSGAEGRVTVQAAVFTRDAQGRLVLLGTVVRGGRGAGTRRLVAGSGSVPSWDEHTPVLVLAAR